MKNYIFLFLSLNMLACSSKKNTNELKEAPVKYQTRLKNPEKAIVPQASNKVYLGAIQFEKDNLIKITLPDSTLVVAKQKNSSNRQYFLAKDTFLIFNIKNLVKGFEVLAKDNKKLWTVTFDDKKIKIAQADFDKNSFDIELHQESALVKQKEKLLGEVKSEDKKIALYNTKKEKIMYLDFSELYPSLGVLLIEDIGVEERYAIFSELLARGY